MFRNERLSGEGDEWSKSREWEPYSDRPSYARLCAMGSTSRRHCYLLVGASFHLCSLSLRAARHSIGDINNGLNVREVITGNYLDLVYDVAVIRRDPDSFYFIRGGSIRVLLEVSQRCCQILLSAKRCVGGNNFGASVCEQGPPVEESAAGILSRPRWMKQVRKLRSFSTRHYSQCCGI